MPPDATPTPVRTRSRSVWRWLAGLLALSLAVVVAGPLLGAWALSHSPAFLTEVLNRLAGVKAEGVSGSLAGDDLVVDKLEIALPGDAGRLRLAGVALSGATLTLSPGPGWRPRLVALRLSARSVGYFSGPTAPTATPPPTDLRLPLTLLVGELTIDHLQIDDGPPVSALRARVAVDDAGQHRVDALSLQVEGIEIRGAATLATTTPLALRASLHARSLNATAPTAASASSAAATRRWHASATAEGVLAAIDVAAQAADDADSRLALSASARLLPFAAWPLPTLKVSARHFDLSALSPRWPATALTGDASIESSGVGQALIVKARIDNEAARRSSEAGLPLRRLVLALNGAARSGSAVEIGSFDLALGDAGHDAGHWRGSGSWRGGELALTTSLVAVKPDAIDSRLAATTVSGPLTIKVAGLPEVDDLTGLRAPSAAGGASATASKPATNPASSAPAAAPRLSFETTLKGRNAVGTAVELSLAGSAQADRIDLTRIVALAGEASARADAALLRLGSAWQLRSKGRLERFDPKAWWPGAASSAWRSGVHRLDGDWQINLTLPPAGALAALGKVSVTAPAASAAQKSGADAARAPWTAPGSDALRAVMPALQALRGDATIKLADSLVAGTAVNAAWVVHADERVMTTSASVIAAGNRLSLAGRLSPRDASGADHWQFDLAAPRLAGLTPLLNLVPAARDLTFRSGAANGEVVVDGRWPNLQVRAQLRADELRFIDPALPALASSTLAIEAGAQADSRLKIDWRTTGWQQGERRIDSLALQVDGSWRHQRIELTSTSPVKPPAWTEALLGPPGDGTRLSLAVESDLEPLAERWRWRFRDGRISLSAGGARSPPLAASAAASSAAAVSPATWLTAQNLAAVATLDRDGRLLALQIEPGRIQSPAAALRWREASWQAGTPTPRLAVHAELEAVAVATVLARWQPGVGWRGDLSLGGRIDIDADDRLNADAVLERVAGDLKIVDERGREQALGLTELKLALSAHDGVWQFAQGFAGSGVGEAAGAQVVHSTARDWLPSLSAPLQGVVSGHVKSLGIWANWVPVGWRIAGNLNTTANIGGSLNAPEFSGSLASDGLSLRNPLLGINLSDGELALSLKGDHAEIERFTFKGGDGTLKLSGSATLGAAPLAKLELGADKFRLLGRVDRRLVVSGSAALALSATSLSLDGKVRVDEGLFDFSRADAPSLADDVTILRPDRRGAGPPGQAASATPGSALAADAAASAAALPMATLQRDARVAIAIDLGDKLRVRGHGLDSGLRGALTVSNQGGRVAVNGRIRTDAGTYAAYAQKLVIDKGELTFNGAFDNPRLDIIALRPDLDVRVGVTVSGSAQSPRARLFSEPDMPDNDKLSWLLLGRASEGLGRGDTALLQRAAVALIAGEGKSPTDALINQLGLTDLSLRQSDTDTKETIVTLGRQLSRRWYAGYERSLNATAGTWQLIYRIAQRFTLRAQSGADNSLDVIWSWKWN